VPEAVETLEPSTVVTEESLHLAVTPLPQDTFLPWKASSSGHLPFRPIFENLTTIDPNTGPSKIYPQLATEWEMSPDAQTWTFHLRQGIPFHFDQGEFTAKDLIPTIDKAMEVGSLTGCRGSMSAMMGAESATQMMQQGNLETVDDYTFTMKLARPQVDLASWWFNILQVPCAMVWSSAQFEAEGEAMFENCPAGTGAYQFVRRTLKEFTEYERVPYDHWRVNPEFKTLRISTIPEDATRLAMILAGEADMVDIPKVLHDQAINAGMVVLESPLPAVGLHVQMYGQYYVSKVNYTPEENPWAAPGETGRKLSTCFSRAGVSRCITPSSTRAWRAGTPAGRRSLRRSTATTRRGQSNSWTRPGSPDKTARTGSRWRYGPAVCPGCRRPSKYPRAWPRLSRTSELMWS
jgi:ABC-type transport system substrate-binding protein